MESCGYYHSPEDAGRAADYHRWRAGLAPQNYPDDLDATIADATRWTTRRGKGPRGLRQAMLDVVVGGDGVTTRDVWRHIGTDETTLATVGVTLYRLRRDGLIRHQDGGSRRHVWVST